MTQKAKPQKSAESSEDQSLQQDNIQWLNEFRDVLSPYWSSRLEYQPGKKAHVLVLEKTTRQVK